jgi:UDP-N-acetylmuramyl pentapeptide phosphotransferase/UDP-N-acetylglucosamine-1-phosphate transferase
LIRYALAKPNNRSSHTVPTPQGAGVAIVAATLAVGSAAALLSTAHGNNVLPVVFIATLFIAIIGAIDDIRPIQVVPRLIAHTVAVGAILWTLPNEIQLFPGCPWTIERGLLLIAGVWFVNLVNFMDGLDWMTVAEVVPITTALVVLGAVGEVSPLATLIAAALCGAILGFAPFNRPVARIFLGDVGSLPIGLLLGWMLLDLASHGQIVAAALLPLYYLADATVTMLRRALNGERFWMAHRSHFYQRATNNGFTVLQVVSHVFMLNVALTVFAILTVLLPSAMARTLLLLAGMLAVAAVMYRFQRSPGRPLETPAPH